MDEMLGADGALGTGVELTGCKECLWLRTANAAAANRPAVLWLIDEMGRGLHGRALDAGTLAPVEATIKVGARWPSYNDPEVGDFHHYLRPADYPVRVIANGYDEQNLVAHVEDEAPPQLDVELAPSSRRTTFAVRIVNNSVYEYAPPDPPLGFNFLGRPDGATLPLGIAGFATLDLSRDGITDGPGADIAVYEGWDPTGDEPFELWGGDQPYGPWTLIGAGVGTTEFDLADSGLASVRYVQVRDASSAAESGKAVWPGFDLDAVGSPGLLANFTASPQFVAPGGTVSFTDVSRGGPTGWLWDFGDGETSTDHNPSHAYANLGFYTVSLTIDGPGGPDTIVKRDLIGVVDAPTAEFSGAPQSLTAGETVQFADASTGYVTAYHWEFGDNYTSAEKDPAHAYRKAGDYSVVLTITGLVGGDEEVKYDYIHVDPAADDDDDDDNDDNDDIDDDDNDNDDDDNNDNDDNDDNDDNNDNNDYAADDDNDATSGSDGEDSGGCGC
jgi:PKD repeat protein